MANTYSLDLESSSSQYAYITDANQTGLDITGDFTIEAWLKFETLPSVAGKKMTIAGKWADGVRQYIMQITTANKLEITCSDNGSDSSGHWVRFTSNSAIISETGVWYHIAGTFDISEETATMYVNGSSKANTKSGSIGATLTNQNNPFRIGSSIDGSYGEYFDGLIDDVRVWNDIRTGQEISSNYQKELVGNEAGLVAYYKFNDSALDETSNNNDLTLSGSPSYSTDVPTWVYTIICAAGSYAWTGKDIAILRILKIVCAVGSYTWTGYNAIIKKVRRIVCSAGSYLWTGYNMIFKGNFWTNKTKPSSTWTEGTKPSTSWTNEDNINK